MPAALALLLDKPLAVARCHVVTCVARASGAKADRLGSRSRTRKTLAR
jgi:hypothetical protein